MHLNRALKEFEFLGFQSEVARPEADTEKSQSEYSALHRSPGEFRGYSISIGQLEENLEAAPTRGPHEKMRKRKSENDGNLWNDDQMALALPTAMVTALAPMRVFPSALPMVCAAERNFNPRIQRLHPLSVYNR
ncbi:MAG: hypothetical protein WA555_14095 [Candidatus Sulfotelmatobacter sp.]